MSVSNSQHANELEEIQRRFSSSPFIQITATSGNPPDSYEVTYHVKGISEVTDGQAVIVDSHRVSIVLPFGYPHFPPNCKPLTSIFHPDFDPDAVCIGDFWNSSHSLAELIVHIGRLISYQTYGQEDVFNREALEWARANGDLLPLDQADFSVQKPEAQQDGVTPAAEQGESPVELSTATGDDKALPTISQPDGQDIQKVTGRGAKQASAAGRKNRKLLLAAICAVLLLAGGVGALLLLDTRNFEGAVHKWAEVAPLVSQSRFTEADKQVKAVQALLDKVYFFKKEEKLALVHDVSKLTDSQTFKEGLQGRVQVDGRYISVRQQQDINALNGLLAKALELADAGKWQEAGETYALAEEKATVLGELAPVPRDKVRELSSSTRLQWRMEEGNLFRSQHKWEQAQSSFQEAMESLAGMPQDEQWLATRSKIQTLITEVAFSAAVEQGNQFFADRQWSQAADSYQSALQIVADQGGELAQEAKKIEGQRDVARFNFIYEAGLQDFSDGKWDAAIAKLEKSEGLLAAALAAGGAREISRAIIKKKILSATVNRGEIAVAAYLAEEKYSQVVKELQAIINAIDRNQLGTDKEFAPVRKSAAERVGKYLFLADIQQKIAYLLGRYEVIFKEFFPSSARSKLSDPQITFVRQEGSLLIFNMQCQEENRRQKFRLEMNYQYDSKSGQWSPIRHADVSPAGST